MLFRSASINLEIDNQGPVVSGTGPNLGTVGSNSIALNWGTATDNSTASGSIQYMVRRHSASMGSEIEGSLSMGWSAGIYNHTVTGLNPLTLYYVRVFAKDQFGNVSALPSELSASTTIPLVYTFGTGGLLGRTGPSQAELDAVYSATNLAGAVTSSGGIQLWTVPASGTYRIEAKGAKGGSSGALSGGNGAVMAGDVHLVSGEVLRILVGQSAVTYASGAVGGGGGTFVVRSPYNSLASVLVVAVVVVATPTVVYLDSLPPLQELVGVARPVPPVGTMVMVDKILLPMARVQVVLVAS